MTQKEKLIELIHEFGLRGYEINDLADYLIANGTVILPCNVGDTVNFGSELQHEVSQFVMFNDGKMRYVLEGDGYILRPEITDERVTVCKS